MSWVCPKCERELKHLNAWHNCVKISLDTLFKGRDPELILVFDSILAEVADWENVLVSTSKNCIVFVHKQTFLIIRPMKKDLDIKFYSAEAIQNPAILKTLPEKRNHANHIRLVNSEQVNAQLFQYLRASYHLF